MKKTLRRENLPIAVTALTLVLLFGGFSFFFKNFLSVRVIANLFINNAHVGVIAVGLTFVILSGGIDLSVGSVMAFTTIFVATLIEKRSMHPLFAILLALGVGTLFGTAMGAMIQVYKLPPFLVTLAGMFLARGLAFVVSSTELSIRHPFYGSLGEVAIRLNGVRIGLAAIIFVGILAAGCVIAHSTRFGRNVYAVGGNENSAVLMGLPVAATKIAIYAISGFCAALGGIVFTIQAPSGNPLNGQGLELDAIAAVVIGGTLLTGGVGYMEGTLLGVLIYGTILTAPDYVSGFDSSWQRIAIGGLLLGFILLQRFLARAAAQNR
jgi:ribose/xylose/arabinose/galactoside ABC-type transport system permease subunit